jgi:asparagine synthetase B (glutamine-hydrolysing)
MPQFLIHVGADPLAQAQPGLAAARAHDVLFPGTKRTRMRGAGYDGWYGPDRAASRAEVFRSATGDHLVVAGSWFARDSGIRSLEDLARSVERHGVEYVANELDGPFALVVCDTAKRAVHVVTDLAGTMHVFAMRWAGGWAISTSSSWLAALGSSTLDDIGVHEFLATGIVYEDRTLWKGVRKLGQARLITFAADGDVSERRYWSFEELVPERDDLDASVARLVEGTAQAAKAISSRYPRVLCDITGGYDSRATIAGFLMTGLPFGGTVSGPAESPDVIISRMIASGFGIEHRHMAPSFRPTRADVEDAVVLTDGEYDAAEYARIASIHREHARHHDVSVNGSFGELARGYWWELLWPSLAAPKPLDSRMVAQKRFAAAAYDRSLFAASHFDLVDHMTRVIERANAPLQGLPNTTLMDHAYFALRMQRWQGRIASSTARIWPNVSPFAFRPLLEATLEAKASLRIRSQLIRAFLHRSLPALAAYPLEGGYPAIPARISNLHRFWPVVPHYATKVTAKISRMTTGRGGKAQRISLAEPIRLTSHEVQLLHASGAFARDALDRISDGAASPQYTRLLTLGMALSKLAASREALREPLDAHAPST